MTYFFVVILLFEKHVYQRQVMLDYAVSRVNYVSSDVLRVDDDVCTFFVRFSLFTPHTEVSSKSACVCVCVCISASVDLFSELRIDLLYVLVSVSPV